MDIQQAIDTLSGAIITKQKEIDALNLASKILSDKFVAEFTSRNQALYEMNATYTKLDEEKVKTNILTTNKIALEKTLVEKDVIIAELLNQAKTPVEILPITPIL